MSSRNFQSKKEISIHKTLIFSLEDKKIEDIENDMYEKIESNLPDSEQLYENDQLFYEGLKNFNVISNICSLFSIILILGTMLCCFRIFEVFYRDYQKKLAVLRSYGAKKYHTVLIVLYQSFIFTSFSFFISLPIGLFLKKFLNNYTFKIDNKLKTTTLLDSSQLALIWIGLLFISLCTVGLIIVIKYNKNSVVSNLKGSQLSANKYQIYQRIINLPFRLKSIVIQMLFFWKSSLLMITIITFSIMFFFFSQLIAGETVDRPSEIQPDYTVSSKQLTAEEQVNGFTIETNQSVAFDFKSVEKLQHTPGVLNINKVPNSLGSTLLLTQEQLSPYIKTWIQTHKADDINKEISQSMINNLKTEEDINPIPSVNFVLVGDSDLRELKNHYYLKNRTIDNMKKSKIALMFFPDANEINLNTSLEPDEKVKIGRIELKPTKKSLAYKEWNFKIGEIINKPFKLKKKTISDDRDGITVVIHENIAKKIKMFDGYKELNIYLDRNISKKNKTKVSNKIKQLVSSIPGSLYYSSEEDNKELESISNYLSILGNVLFVIITLYSALSLSIMMYSRVIQKQAELAINRAFGKSIKEILKDLQIEMVIYLIGSFLISGTVVSIIMLISPPTGSALFYMNYYVYAVIIISIVSIFSLLIPYHKIKNTSIIASLRSEES
ncbi:ABC transporter permease [Bacillus spizizenii]|nr:ABC transporter permease [Bacillus spizizenii]